MKKLKIIHNGDDWEALYVDGIKVSEDHALRLEEVLEILGYSVDTEEVPSYNKFYEDNPEGEYEATHFPEVLKE